jgi:transposase
MGKFTPHKYQIHLSDEQRQNFGDITANGKSPAKKIRHAFILLLSDEQRQGGPLSDPAIANQLGVSVKTVERTRKRFVTQGEQPALERKKRLTPPVAPKIDGNIEAHLVAICCSKAPEGHVRWTLRLLADELVKRRLVPSVCAETIRQTLKKTSCSPGGNASGAFQRNTRPAS